MPTTTKKSPRKDLAQLVAEENTIRAASDARIAKLRAERAEENKIRHPLNVLIQRRTDKLEAITRVAGSRVVPERWLVEFRQKMDLAIGSDHGLQDTLLYMVHNDPLLPYLIHAERFLTEIDRWIAERKAELVAIEGEILAYAAEHDLGELLPAELGAKS